MITQILDALWRITVIVVLIICVAKQATELGAIKASACLIATTIMVCVGLVLNKMERK